MPYIGIDYGLGRTNVARNGMRYGVINQSSFYSWDAEAEYPRVIEFECDHCHRIYNVTTARQKCKCGEDVSQDVGRAFEYLEPEAFDASEGDVVCRATDPSFGYFVTKSPYYTECAYCSPCAPGAGSLDTAPVEGGVKTLCLPKEFFENDACPYPYWEVKTGRLVYEPAKQTIMDAVQILPADGVDHGD